MMRLFALVVMTSCPAVDSAMSFKHPGALDSKEGLDFVKAKILAGEQPWLNWFNIAKVRSHADRTPHGVSKFDANGAGAQDGGDDAGAAYVQALLWYYSDDETYAERSIAILNSWSQLQEITANNEQNKLQAGWMGADFGPAAEIMRLYKGWDQADIAAFQAMLKRAFYPLLNTMSFWNGNVDLTQIDAMLSLAVVNEDEDEFNLGLTRLAERSPSYFYLKSDGATPPAIDGDGGDAQTFWSNPTQWIDGLTQETCRDNGHHAQFALGSALHACETAWNQGVDVYATHEKRYTSALELLSLQLSSGDMQSTCPNAQASRDKYDTFEIGYNHYTFVSGSVLPNTHKLVADFLRVTDNDTPYCAPKYTEIYGSWNLVMETLTHADINNINTITV